MQIIENLKVKEKVYIEKLENGLTVMIIPKKGVQKKYVIWGTNYGSNDSKFVVPGEQQETEVPKGIAHWEHFYQYLLLYYIVMGYLIIKKYKFACIFNFPFTYLFYKLLSCIICNSFCSIFHNICKNSLNKMLAFLKRVCYNLREV